MNRKDKRRVARLRMEELHAGNNATRPPPPEPVAQAPSEHENPGVADRPQGFPNVEQQFRPGQTGNPDGYSRGRRITDALHRALNKSSLLDDVATTMIAMALGQKLPNRTPDLLWFRELRDMIDGSPRFRERDAPETTDMTIDPAVIVRMLAAADPENLPVLEEDDI